ncbi:Qat anti-phage system QueC-like protein QatC [Paenibacillus sp. FSL E2-0190]|uniref:Qat anti-phage system QueC-like protein QatC n=1 Tax=Paenibacillus sp. FSL E2-0190 TaxID=2954504 RepID=UPI0030ED0FAB
MNDIWIVKNEQQVDAQGITFNLSSKNNKSNIKSDIENLWRMFSLENVSPIIEDFLIIGMAIFTVDKKVSRKFSTDGWSRGIIVHIPVLELQKWLTIKTKLEKTLSFLSGDTWSLSFYSTEERFRGDKINKDYSVKNRDTFDCVSLFSGGLDSFCGALTLMEEKKNPLFLGFKEYPLLIKRQQSLFKEIQQAYGQQSSDFVQFSVTPSKPININESVAGESTSRSRSFLFIAGAVAVASIIGENTPVYIPENGFIGINVPLTQSRSGSCSTRTTHPFFLKLLNEVLDEIGITHQVKNFYSGMTKGEIVKEHKNNVVFRERFKETLSCSHPCQGRYDGVSPPVNCGYCYPCLIRRASLIVNDFFDDHYNVNYELNRSFIEVNNKLDGKASDLKAVLFTLKRYVDKRHDQSFIRRLLRIQGPLTSEEINSYERVYRESLKEILQMIDYEEVTNGGGLKNYMDLKESYEELS